MTYDVIENTEAEMTYDVIEPDNSRVVYANPAIHKERWKEGERIWLGRRIQPPTDTQWAYALGLVVCGLATRHQINAP